MTVRAILTDLDGTLLEPDGRACEEVRGLLAELDRAAVPVCPLTSKTVAEVRAVLRELPLSGPAGIENGAALVREDGAVELAPSAVPLAELASVALRLRDQTGAPLRTLLELSDAELSALTGLSGAGLESARERCATLPLVVAAAWDDAMRGALPPSPPLRLVRGNRFLHLQGDHDKGDAVPAVLACLRARKGPVVALGDSPNDEGMLARADVAVIVPGESGPDPRLLGRLPHARVAPLPHGRGWAVAVRALLASGEAAASAGRPGGFPGARAPGPHGGDGA